MVVRFSPFSVTLSQQSHHRRRSSCFSKQVTVSCSYGMKRNELERPQILSSALGNSDGSRVFVVSDLHTDYDENLKWVECLSTVNYKDDVLLVAGDVAETYKTFFVTMSLLRERFEHVFYVPGNHDLWCRREGKNYVRSLYPYHEVQVHAYYVGYLTHTYILGVKLE